MYSQKKLNLNLIYRKYIYYLIVLIIPTLVIGPSIPDIIISYLAIICLFHLIINQINIFKNKIFILFIFFYLILIISSLLSDYTQFSLRSSSVYIRFILFSILIALVYENFPKIIYWFSIVAFVTILIVIFDAIFQYIFSYNILGFERKHLTRVSGLFQDKYVLGSFIIRIMPISLIFLFFNNKKFDNFKNKLVIILYFSIIAIGIILSGERTALIYFLIISFLFVLIFYYLRKIFFLIILFFLIIFSVLIVVDKDIKIRFFDTTIKELGLNNNNFKINIFSEVHQQFYSTSILMFKDNIIFGTGPNTYRKKCEETKYFFQIEENNQLIKVCATHPHNSYIQLLAETGILAFIIIVCLFIFLVSKLINFFIINKHLNNTDIIQVLLLIACFVSLFPFVPNGNFFNNWLTSIYFLPVGFLLMHLKK